MPITVGPPPTELVSEDLTVGTGATVEPTSTVTVDYIGVSCSTGKIFDTSYGKTPATFPLDRVIPGWQQGLPGMKVGGIRLLGIPADLAYGAQGYPPDIAPDETLWFVVDAQGRTSVQRPRVRGRDVACRSVRLPWLRRPRSGSFRRRARRRAGGRRGMRVRKPAATRASSDSPPQNPYSRCSRAQSRHGATTGQTAQTSDALSSRTAARSGRSAGGPKNSDVLPTQAARSAPGAGRRAVDSTVTRWVVTRRRRSWR